MCGWTLEVEPQPAPAIINALCCVMSSREVQSNRLEPRASNLSEHKLSSKGSEICSLLELDSKLDQNKYDLTR
jgi:hypothetical protein